MKTKNKAKNLYNKVWRLFSLKVRLKAADTNGYVSCVTCGVKKNYKEMNAGHYKHGVLDFDERNIHPQCVKCNKWESGKLDVYNEYLLIELGREGLAILVEDSYKAKLGERFTQEELEKKVVELKAEIKKLQEVKNG